MPSLEEIIVDSATAGLDLQAETGAMPAGHNGPYHDPETPVRNTAHWLVTFLSAHEHTGDDRFWDAADRALSYLLGEEARPDDWSFSHRTGDDKDQCNGLIGQAWTIEALAEAVDAGLRPQEACNVATEVFLAHPFDEALALWKRVEPDGSVLPYDRTFNHQVWFAAAGGLLIDGAGRDAVPSVESQVQRFLERLPELMRLYDDGVVYHPLRPEWTGGERLSLLRPGKWRLLKNDCFALVRPPSSRRRLRKKAIGYHSFNLYGLALLKLSYPDHEVWNHVKIERALAVLQTKSYQSQISDNPYGYPYNPPGFENALALQVFGDRDRIASEWVDRQLQTCYDPESYLMTKCSEDENTAAARLYEATRII
ncbi:hypothetical protein AArcSl_2917 [Halalkaliarchaeum desulfuricum]|uniref:Agl cluster protein AglQ n=1 Tax=Halalkaliarchaeum desulfuricum TaxID=2055893 RepID=A0A343TN56_9EURY|nr:agl cluster protein AglQ [Halalkaliarchaeum desulfuricum]AUX10528.1 hypothetical protein AArcSl_2917 [Halalkaliarchaeum desulfuricum]